MLEDETVVCMWPVRAEGRKPHTQRANLCVYSGGFRKVVITLTCGCGASTYVDTYLLFGVVCYGEEVWTFYFLPGKKALSLHDALLED